VSPVRTSGTALGTAPAPRRAPGSRPAPRPAPPLRLVPDAELGRRRRALARLCTALAVVLSAVGLFFVVFLQVLLTQGQAELDRLNARAEVEAAQNRRLRVAVAELESPDRIVGVARQRLGMVPPATVTYLQAAGPSDPLPPVPAGAPPTTTATTAPSPVTTASPRPTAATSASPRPTATAAADGRRATTATTTAPRHTSPATTVAPRP
jgi:cell division protein FtsL